MVNNIIHDIASSLIKLENNPKLTLTNPKFFTSKGLILESYAKQNRLSKNSLEKLINNNTFFKLSITTIQTGLFSKKDKTIPIIEWEQTDIVKKKFIDNPDRVIKESLGSEILLLKTIFMINDAKFNESELIMPKRFKFNYEHLKEDRIKLYEKYFPEDLEKYQHEGKQETDLEKKFKKQVPKGTEFHFSDGKVAHNLLTWVQCIQMAPNDVIEFHIMNDDFYQWLEDTFKVPELARICFQIKKGVQSETLLEKEIKYELLLNINKTSLSNIIFETLINPLLRSVKSEDQSKAQDAVDRLINTGDLRVVEPLMEKLFDSGPQLRQKIIIGLGKLRDKRATPALLKILKHSTNIQDRLLALKTLGIIKDKRSLRVLKDLKLEKGEIGTEAQRVFDVINR